MFSDVKMSCVLRKDTDWVLTLSSTNIGGALTLLSEDGCQVQVPAELLVAVSPLIKSMMSDLLPPAYSPHVISIPAVTGASLLLVAEILLKGTAVVNENMGEVKEVFKMLRIEATLSYFIADREVKDEDFTEGTEDYSQSEIFVKNVSEDPDAEVVEKFEEDSDWEHLANKTLDESDILEVLQRNSSAENEASSSKKEKKAEVPPSKETVSSVVLHMKHKIYKKRDLLNLSGQVVTSQEGVIELETGKRFRKIPKKKKKSNEKAKDDLFAIDNSKELEEKCLDGILVKQKRMKNHKDRNRDLEPCAYN